MKQVTLVTASFSLFRLSLSIQPFPTSPLLFSLSLCSLSLLLLIPWLLGIVSLGQSPGCVVDLLWYLES